MLERWKAEGLFQRTLDAGAAGSRSCSTRVRPPRTAGPGIHHVFSRTIKDLICRYHAMQGQEVTRIAGWDTHGLPVEIEVEKELKLSGKKDIETFGVAEFNARARKSVFKYQSDWESLSDRIGYWLDYEHPYITCSNEYIETVWWLLRRLHERDLLYRGHRVLPYCPRCGTVLSSHELALGLRGGHHQLGLRDLPAGRRSVAPAPDLDHDALDPAVATSRWRRIPTSSTASTRWATGA